MSVLNLDIVSPLDCHVSRIGSILLSALRPVPGGEERALGAEKMVSWMRRASDMHHVQTQSWGALSPMRAVAAFLDELDGERNSSSCAADNTHEVSRVVAAIGTERCRAQSGRGEKRGQSGRGEKREQSGMGEKAGKVGGDMQSIADADPRGDEEVEGGGRMGQVMEAAAGFGRVLGARAQRNWREAAQGASTKVLDAIAAYIDEPGRSDGLASIAEGARLEQAQEADAGMRSREEDGERRGHEVDAAVEREVLVLDAAAVLARCELALHMLERERKEVAEAHEESAEGREVKGGEHNDGRNIGAAEGGAGGRAGEQRTKQKHKAGDRRLALAGIKCGHLMPLLAASNYDARQPEKPPLASFAKYLRDALPGLAILDLSLPSAPAGTSVGGWLTDTALADVLRELGDTVSVLDVSRQGNSARRSLCAGPNFVRALSHASALSELRAVGNATLQGEILEEAIRTCPGKDGIKVLDVRQCKGVDPAAVRSFGELKSLEEVRSEDMEVLGTRCALYSHHSMVPLPLLRWLSKPGSLLVVWATCADGRAHEPQNGHADVLLADRCASRRYVRPLYSAGRMGPRS